MQLVRHWGALAAIVALAVVLRVYQLGDLPAGLYCDEAAIGYNAYSLAKAGIDENGKSWPLYIWSFGVSYKNPVFVYAAMLPVSLLGLSELSVRLTSAAFGVGTVIALFFLGRALFDRRVGLWSALFLAVCPWHLHFSRIAFELIAFPFLFVAAFTLLVRYTQGRRTLPQALLLSSLCVYSYMVAGLFVPLFLLGFAALFAPNLLRRWRETLLAVAVAGAAAAPALIFLSSSSYAGTQYFRHTTFIDAGASWLPQLRQFLGNYSHFFSTAFLFQSGDPLPRHAVPGFGELHVFLLPFLFLGAVLALRRGRVGWLVLWWIALYPVGPSIMNEIPSASRSIIGSAGFCLLAGIGFAGTIHAFRWAMRRPRAAFVAEALVACVGLVLLGAETFRYLRAYVTDYPKQAAHGNAGFQYGYRDVIRHMESRRASYDQLVLSMTDANQPHIFALFYNRTDPLRWTRQHNPGYSLFKPEDYAAYTLDRRALFALHPTDVKLFSDLTIERTVVSPNGETAFVVANVRTRKRFLGSWLGLGLFSNENGSGVSKQFIDPAHLPPGKVQGAFNLIDWRPIRQGGIYVDLNRYYSGADIRTPGNPEWVCAYATTLLTSPSDREGYLEVIGSWGDALEIWLDGRSLTQAPLVLRSLPMRRRIHLPAGQSSLLIKSCETIAWWDFAARITDGEGRDFTDVTTAASLPPSDLAPRPEPPAAELRVVEGFDQIVDSEQPEPGYPDYRGPSESWRASVDRATRVAWRSAAVADAVPTVLAFTASTSEEVAEFSLFADGRFALAFESGPPIGSRSWEGNGYRMTFVPRTPIAGNSGIVLLSLPPEHLRPGQPLEIRVQPGRGEKAGWFMIKGRRDTIAHEQMTPATARQALEGSWEVVGEKGARG